jgi:dihydroneopterin triphosphate diphosphatase
MSRIVCQLVEVCVFRFGKNGPEYLLLERSPHDQYYPGMWQIVTGNMNDGERAPDAALRELREETMLLPSRFWAVPCTSTFYDHAGDVLNVSPLFAAQVEPRAEPALSSEHQRYEWLSYEEARRRIVWPGQRTGLDVVHEYILGGEAAGLLTVIPLP